MIILFVLWLVTFVALIAVAWNAYFKQKEQTQTLAQQIDAACQGGDLGPGLSPEDKAALCGNAQEVIEEDDPELQEGEVQESEIQEPEEQEPEVQEREVQEPEIPDREEQERESQEAEEQDGEIQDDEVQNEETQDPEIQDEETQEPEIQEPEKDDPDPASPYTFSFTFTVPPSSPGDEPDTYHVTCNSGTGECTVS